MTNYISVVQRFFETLENREFGLLKANFDFFGSLNFFYKGKIIFSAKLTDDQEILYDEDKTGLEELIDYACFWKPELEASQ